MKGETLTPAHPLPQESGSESKNSAGLVLGQQFTQFKASILQKVFMRNKRFLIV